MADTENTAAASEENEPQLSFVVKSSAESKYNLKLPISTTIADVKQTLSGADYANLPPDRIRLIYSGKVLKDNDTLESTKVKEGNTVHLVKGAASNSRQNPADSTASSTSTSTNPSQPVPPSNVPTNIAAGTGAGNPLAGLTGARYAGFHGLPGMDAFGADGGMGAPPNPDQMLRLLEDPNFAQQMNEAMNNPAVINMLRENPMIRNNPLARQAIENPEFRRMMMDPNMIRMQMRMQQAMEQGGGGGGGAGGFPMPGQTDTTERGAGTDAAATMGTGSQGTNPTAAGGNAPVNPFAALFGAPPNAMGNPLSPQAGSGTGQQNQSNPMATMAQEMMQNPEMMQQMMQMFGGGAGAPGAGGSPGTGAGTGGAANPFGAFNPFMFGEPGAGGAAAQPADNRPPEERYEQQLRQLNDMGFFEFDRNVQALRRSGGSVQGAIEYLLSNP